MTQTNWTAKVLISFPPNNLDVSDPSLNFVPQVVLIHAGLTSLIAHIRVGLMQVALEAKSAVQPAIGRSFGFSAFCCPDTSDGCSRPPQVVALFRVSLSSLPFLLLADPLVLLRPDVEPSLTTPSIGPTWLTHV